jgi:hypothetical protein
MQILHALPGGDRNQSCERSDLKQNAPEIIFIRPIKKAYTENKQGFI